MDTDEDEIVDIIGEGDDNYSDGSASGDEDSWLPRPTRYDVVFLFELLWRTRNTTEFPKVWLPETIVFRNNQPVGWYFTNTNDGRIMKRNLGQEHFITQKKILEVFDGATGEVAAAFVNTVELDGKRVVSQVQYFDRQHLREFLYIDDPTRNGFLQKFVSLRQQKYGHASKTNQTIQTLHVIWRRGALRTTYAEQRVHFLRLVKPDKSAQKPSFDHAVADTRSSVTLAPQSPIVAKISEACQAIVDHVQQTTEDAVKITRMKCHFKMGQRGIIWLNFCTSADIEPRKTVTRPAMQITRGFQDLQLTSEAISSLRSGALAGNPSSNFGVRGSRSNRPNIAEEVANFEGHKNESEGTPYESPRRAKTGGATERSWSLSSPRSVISPRSEAAFAANQRAVSQMCGMCSVTIDARSSCTVTYQEVMHVLSRWQDRAKQANSFESRPITLSKSKATGRPHARTKKGSTLWKQMRLTDEDEISLPELQWRLKQIEFSDESVARIEVSIAAVDTGIRGVIDLNLFNKALGAPFGMGEENQSQNRQFALEGATALDPEKSALLHKMISPLHRPAGPQLSRLFDEVYHVPDPLTDPFSQRPIFPVVLQHLRCAIPRRDCERLTAPNAINVEHERFLSKHIPVCLDCFKCTEGLQRADILEYWNPHLDNLFQIASGELSARIPRISTKASLANKPNRIDVEWSRKFQSTTLRGDSLPALTSSTSSSLTNTPRRKKKQSWQIVKYNGTHSAPMTQRSSQGQIGTDSPRMISTAKSDGATNELLHTISDDQLLAEFNRRDLQPAPPSSARRLNMKGNFESPKTAKVRKDALDIQEERAAVLIQSRARGMAERKMVGELQESKKTAQQEEKAAVLIQSRARGMSERHKVEDLKASRNAQIEARANAVLLDNHGQTPQTELHRDTSSAPQDGHRHHPPALPIKELRAPTPTLSTSQRHHNKRDSLAAHEKRALADVRRESVSSTRRKSVVSEDMDPKEAAIMIQSRARGMRDRKALKEGRLQAKSSTSRVSGEAEPGVGAVGTEGEKRQKQMQAGQEERAAVTIQSRTRGIQARKVVSSRRVEEEKMLQEQKQMMEMIEKASQVSAGGKPLSDPAGLSVTGTGAPAAAAAALPSREVQQMSEGLNEKSGTTSTVLSDDMHEASVAPEPSGTTSSVLSSDTRDYAAGEDSFDAGDVKRSTSQAPHARPQSVEYLKARRYEDIEYEKQEGEATDGADFKPLDSLLSK